MIRTLFKHPAGPVRNDASIDDLPSLLAQCAANRGMLWIDMMDELPNTNSDGSVEPSTDASINHVLRDVFAFDALAVDDALAETHIPRVDDWSTYIYIVLHAVAFKHEIEDIDTHELDIFLGHNYLLTYHFEDIPELEHAWKQCQRDDRIWRNGSDYMLYTLADAVASGYMPCMDEIDDVSDKVLDTVFDRPSPQQVERIFSVKRAVLKLRRILGPQREVMNKLAREGFAVVEPKNRVYFRDVYDHFVRMADLNESLRDIVAGSLDTYLSVTANRTNDVMKVLTIVTLLFAPLTFITGFFGMNFFGSAIELPDAQMGWLVFAIGLTGMVLAPIGIIIYIRRQRWL